MKGDPEPSEFSRFFEHGHVEIEGTDAKTRQAAISMQLPCCLFQAVVPSLLGAGFIDNFRISEPLCVWIPKVTKERLSLQGSQVDNAVARINTTVEHQAAVIIKTFSMAAELLHNPADLVPMLPLGVYVSLRFRCRVDDIPKFLTGVQGTPVDGVPELQWALACVLAKVLMESQAWGPVFSLEPAP